MFYIFMLQIGDSIYETPTQQSLQFDVCQLMKDKKISTSVDLLKVLQKTMEKKWVTGSSVIKSSTNRRDQIKDSIADA